jgi:hypothetical protein
VENEMNNVEMKAQELNNDMNEVKRELKRVASVKSRLKRQQGKSTYEKEMSEVLQYEELLKEVRSHLNNGSGKSVPQYTEEDVQVLSYDETIRAIKSIQSKKSLSKWLTPIDGDNDEYRNACRVEELLRAHKETLQPSGVNSVSKNDLQSIVDMSDDLSKDELVEMLKNLL